MMPRAYQLGIHLLKTNQLHFQCVRFARGRRGVFDPDTSDKLYGHRNSADASAYDEYALAEDLREVEDLVKDFDERDASLGDLRHGEGKQTRQWLKNKILEKKHFKQPQEANLLTWAAKAQIRYLNQQSPEEWTPERLAQSFPISQEGVVRLLKSKWAPRKEEERIKHDTRVFKQWKALAKAGSSSSTGSGPMNPVLQQLLESQKLGLMQNAQGIAGLPAPVPSLPATRTETAGRASTLGPFSSILLQVQPKLKPPTASASQVRVLEEAESLMKKFRLLDLQHDMSGRVGSQDAALGRRTDVPKSEQMQEFSTRKQVPHFSTRNERSVESGRREASQGRIPPQPQWELPQSERLGAEERVPLNPSRRRQRRSGFDRDENIKSMTPDALLQLQMQGTYKIPRDSTKKDGKGEED